MSENEKILLTKDGDGLKNVRKRRGAAAATGEEQVKRRSLSYDFFHRACPEIRYVYRDQFDELSGAYDIIMCRYSSQSNGSGGGNVDYRRTLTGKVLMRGADSEFQPSSNMRFPLKNAIEVQFNESDNLPFIASGSFKLRHNSLDDSQMPYTVFRVQELPELGNATVYAHLSRFVGAVPVGLLRDNLTHHRRSPVEFRTTAEAQALNDSCNVRSEKYWLCRHKSFPVELVTRIRQFLVPPPCFIFKKGDLQLFLTWNCVGYNELTIICRPVLHG